jgi:hypothetical protein
MGEEKKLEKKKPMGALASFGFALMFFVLCLVIFYVDYHGNQGTTTRSDLIFYFGIGGIVCFIGGIVNIFRKKE